MNQERVEKKDIIDKGLETPEDSDEDDVVDEVKVYKKDIKKQRESVSAEAYGQWNKKENFKPKVVQKSQELQQRIIEKINQAFMFNALNQKEKEIVMLAMEEKQFKKGDWVIEQGKDGNELYVIDKGELDCFKKYSDQNEPTYLKTYNPGESFGELALLYNAPRAASIQAKSDSVLFSLDRETFNHIVKDASVKKRQQFEEILVNWSILKSIDDPYEKTKIADILVERHTKQGEAIIPLGDKSGDIYLIAEGEVEALDSNGKAQFKYGKNDYFGEIPVVFVGNSQPFSFVSKSASTVLKVPRGSYNSCLKIVHKIIVDSAQKYKAFVQ